MLVPNMQKTLDWVSNHFGLTVHQAVAQMNIDETMLTVSIGDQTFMIPDHCLEQAGTNVMWLRSHRSKFDPSDPELIGDPEPAA